MLLAATPVLTWPDYVVIAIYLAGTIALGVSIGVRLKTGRDFFLGGRRLPWWAIGMSLVATDIGGTDIIGVGGAAYQVPMQVNKSRQQSLAIRWILLAVREKKGRPAHQKLADELFAAYNKEGAAITRRENVHRMADANKAFAHFAW